MSALIPRRVIAAKLVADELKNIEKAAKAEAVKLSEATGATTFTVKDDDGTKLGTVSVSDGKKTAKVSDESALLAWVKANRPDQLRYVVEPAYIDALKKLAVEHGSAVDKDTGEVIPGIEVTEGDPFASARPTAEAKALMHDLLAGSSLLELAGGETDA